MSSSTHKIQSLITRSLLQIKSPAVKIWVIWYLLKWPTMLHQSTSDLWYLVSSCGGPLSPCVSDFLLTPKLPVTKCVCLYYFIIIVFDLVHVVLWLNIIILWITYINNWWLIYISAAYIGQRGSKQYLISKILSLNLKTFF